MEGLLTFECDEVKLVHQNVIMDGYVKKPSEDERVKFEIYFGLREPLNLTVNSENAVKLEARLMEILKEQDEKHKQFNKKFDRYLKDTKTSPKKKR